MRTWASAVVGWVLVASPAFGQEVDEHWPRYCLPGMRAVQRGAFPRLEALLAPGASAHIAASEDVDGDGSADALLEVTPAPSSPGMGCSSVLVLARHTAAGWLGEVVECNTGPTSFTWAPPVHRGASVLLVATDNSYDRDEHTTSISNQRLRRLRGGVFAPVGSAQQAPATATPPAPAPAPLPERCRATLRASFHLRPSEQVETGGAALPAGTSVEVLGTTTMLRAGARLYRVQASGGATGFAFVRSEEFVNGCTPP